MKFIWKSTGDFLEFSPINEDFAEFYVNAFPVPFNLHSTNFNQTVINDLENCVSEVNKKLVKFGIKEFPIHKNLYSQEVLNRLHEQWVKMHIAYPNLPILINKIDPKLKIILDNINVNIHKIESNFEFEYQSYDTMVRQVDNPFGTKHLQFGKFDIKVQYNNLGRSSFNKWQARDTNAIDFDTNNYIKVGGSFIVDLGERHYTSAAPFEYVEYCKNLNIEPVADILPLGNITNYELARELFVRNIAIESNPIMFEL